MGCDPQQLHNIQKHQQQQITMYSYKFLNSPLCLRQAQPPKQAHPFQHQLPPDSPFPKPTKQSQKLNEALTKKTEETRLLLQKNNELIAIINQKEMEKMRVSKKYGELVQLYEEIKAREDRGDRERGDERVQGLVQENLGLGEKIRRLERELIEAEKEIIRKVKFYQDKNEDSRKLLEKLNQNLTKRQQKFKLQLQQTQNELKKKTLALSKLEQQYRYLQSLHSQKEDQLTKILQETERDRSAFSQNISTTQLKLQSENTRLQEELAHLNGIVQEIKRETGGKIRELGQGREGLARELDRMNRENQGLREQVQGLRRELGMLRDGLESEEGKVLELEIREKEMEGRWRLAQVQVQQFMEKLKNKTLQYQHEQQKNRQLQDSILTLQHQLTQTQTQLTTLQQTTNSLTHSLQSQTSQSQTLQSSLHQKISLLTSLELSLQEQRSRNRTQARTIEDLQKLNEDVRTSVRVGAKKIQRLEELLEGYKRERGKVREENQGKWKEMTMFYQGEIQKLNARIVGLQKLGRKGSPVKNVNVLHNESDYS